MRLASSALLFLLSLDRPTEADLAVLSGSKCCKCLCLLLDRAAEEVRILSRSVSSSLCLRSTPDAWFPSCNTHKTRVTWLVSPLCPSLTRPVHTLASSSGRQRRSGGRR